MRRWFRAACWASSLIGLSVAASNAAADTPLRAQIGLGARQTLARAVIGQATLPPCLALPASEDPIEMDFDSSIEVAFALAAPQATRNELRSEVELGPEGMLAEDASSAVSTSEAPNHCWWMDDAWRQLNAPRSGAVVVMLPASESEEPLPTVDEVLPQLASAWAGSELKESSVSDDFAVVDIDRLSESGLNENADADEPASLLLNVEICERPSVSEEYDPENLWSPSDLPAVVYGDRESLPNEIRQSLAWSQLTSIPVISPLLQFAPLTHFPTSADSRTQVSGPEAIPFECGLEIIGEAWDRLEPIVSRLAANASPEKAGAAWCEMTDRFAASSRHLLGQWGEWRAINDDRSRWLYSGEPIACDLDPHRAQRAALQWSARAVAGMADGLDQIADLIRGWSTEIQRVADGPPVVTRY